MIISKETLSKVRKIVDKHYNKLSLSVLGNSVFTSEEIEDFKKQGLDVDNPNSFLDLIYNYNFLNHQNAADKPDSIKDVRAQQIPGITPVGEAHTAATEHLNEMAKVSIDKLKGDVASRIEGIVRDNNNDYRMNALQNLTRPDNMDTLVKQSSVGKIKQELRDYTGDANRDWSRITTTEISNSVGLGSTDRIVSQNKDTPADEIYVYRVVRDDSALCKWCRSFYMDSDGSPKLYKLSDLLNNGSNFGLKTASWKPVILATHPNERCSQPLQLRPGWELQDGGSVKFIGIDKWKDYVVNKLSH